jgi:serine/threonine protein kinase
MKRKAQNQLICDSCGYQNQGDQQEGYYLKEGTMLIDRYLVGKVLGHGGFGITYIALDTRLEIVVAIKEYLPGDIATRMEGSSTVKSYSGEKKDQYDYGLERFLNEAKTLAQYNHHPCIVSSLDFYKDNNTAYLVMEYLDGIPLSEYINRKGGKISWNETLEIMTPVMDALREVHKSNLVHRDISPDNIFIGKDGQVKLLDFGAARFALGEKSKSLSVVLKPGYAPPEQYTSRGKQGPWTDVYAVAATMYRCVSGDKLLEAMDRMRDQSIDKIEGINQGLQHVLEKALSIYNEDRYQTISEFQTCVLQGKDNKLTVDKTVAMKQVAPQVEDKTEPTAKDVQPERVNNSDQTKKKRFPLYLAASIVVFIIAAFLINSALGGMRSDDYASEPSEQVSSNDSTTGSQNTTDDVDDTDESSIGEVSDEMTENTEKSSESQQDTETGSESETSHNDDEAETVQFVTVPNLIGMDQSKAVTSLENLNLTFTIVEEESDTYSTGEVMKQDISGETSVEMGTKVVLTIAKEKLYSVPNLIGMTEVGAVDALDSQIFSYSIVEEKTNNYPEGTVFKQSLSASSKVKKGSALTLTVAVKKLYIIPNLVGQDRSSIGTLLDSDLTYGIEEVYSNSVANGMVMSQSITSGTEVELGTQLQVVVSIGPEPIPMFIIDHDPLEEGIRLTLDKIGVSYGEEITLDNVLQITELRLVPSESYQTRRNSIATHYSIYHIDALSQLTNLKILDLAYHEVHDISGISGLTKLTELYLENNNIPDIAPLEGLTNLTKLNLGSDYVKDIAPLAGLTKLTMLDISSSKATDISVLSNLSNLTKLDISLMTLNDISVLLELPNLKKVSLFGAKISDTTANRQIIQSLIDLGCDVAGNPFED